MLKKLGNKKKNFRRSSTLNSIIIHYQTPKQRELKFKPRIKYDPQQIYATNYKMWDIFSPESTVSPIFELSYPIKTIRLSLNEFQNGIELR